MDIFESIEQNSMADPRVIESGYVDRKMKSLTRAKPLITSTGNGATP